MLQKTPTLNDSWIIHSNYWTTRIFTHKITAVLSHFITDLPTHRFNDDDLFRIGVKWRSGVMTTSCQSEVDFQNMWMDFNKLDKNEI